MVGSAIVRCLRQNGFSQLILRSRAELDLCNQEAVNSFFIETSPEAVILCAAKVGGIVANQELPAEFIQQNLMIQTNIISAASHAGIKDLLFLGSSCIYPKDCPQPIREEYLMTGPLERSNRPYAVAKISGIEQCWANNRQYDTRYLAVMPSSLYGINDSYHPQYSHVIPGLIRRLHEAKFFHKPQVSAWGTGEPRREFLFSDDLARACLHLLTLPTQKTKPVLNDNHPPLINIGSGEDITIAELVAMIGDIVGYEGSVSWDTRKPDGTLKKLLSPSLMNSLGWHPEISLRDGLKVAYDDYLQRHD